MGACERDEETEAKVSKDDNNNKDVERPQEVVNS